MAPPLGMNPLSPVESMLTDRGAHAGPEWRGAAPSSIAGSLALGWLLRRSRQLRSQLEVRQPLKHRRLCAGGQLRQLNAIAAAQPAARGSRDAAISWVLLLCGAAWLLALLLDQLLRICLQCSQRAWGLADI